MCDRSYHFQSFLAASSSAPAPAPVTCQNGHCATTSPLVHSLNEKWMEDVLRLWTSIDEEFVQTRKVFSVGVSDFHFEALRALYDASSLKPCVDHFNIDTCCVVSIFVAEQTFWLLYWFSAILILFFNANFLSHGWFADAVKFAKLCARARHPTTDAQWSHSIPAEGYFPFILRLQQGRTGDPMFDFWAYVGGEVMRRYRIVWKKYMRNIHMDVAQGAGEPCLVRIFNQKFSFWHPQDFGNDIIFHFLLCRISEIPDYVSEYIL